MKKQLIIILIIILPSAANSQNAHDLFNNEYTNIHWLGIDFSHVKLIGEFSHSIGREELSNTEIRDRYFPAWNNLIIAEPNKYDIAGMLGRAHINYDIDMLMKLNSTASTDEMDAKNTPYYTPEDIHSFVSNYSTEGKEGIGILFLAESLNKTVLTARFHFIAINLSTKEILFQEKLNGKPSGFGLRNYWAGSVYKIIKDIKYHHYDRWAKTVL